MMFIVYISWALGKTFAIQFWLIVPIAVVVGMLFGALLERVFIRPMAGESQFAIVMTTVGLAVALRGILPLIWGVDSEVFAAPFKSQLFEIGPLVLLGEQVFALATFLVVSTGVWAFFRFSRFGVAMRASALDETAALLMGIDVRRLHMVAWSISAGVSALVGVCYALAVGRGPDMWFLGLKSFPATILGGLDSPIGSGVGGLLIGLTTTLSEGYIGQGMKEISGFIIIIVILMVRPYGLFGEKEQERV